MNLMKKISAALFFLISTGAFCASEISTNVYVSKNTSFYPEVNVVIFNGGYKVENVEVSFSLLRSNGLSCKVGVDDAQASFKKYMMRSFFSDFGQSFNTSAVLPAHGFVHRFIVFGSQNITYPCSISYVVKNKETQGIISRGVVDLNNQPDRWSFEAADKKNIEIRYVIERVASGSAGENKILITFLIKNKSNKIFNFNIYQKRLIGCSNAAFDKNVLQGMDGSNMVTESQAYSVALMLLSSGEESQGCQLEIGLKDIYGHFSEILRVPLKPEGEYRDLTPIDPMQ